jgi:hypothetical protein
MSPHPVPDENPTRPTPLTTSSAGTPRLRLLGVALPFVVSLPCTWIDPSLLMIGVIPLLVGAVSGAALRSWWAPPVTALAFLLGSLPGVAYRHGGLTDITRPSLLAGATVYLLFALHALALGTLVGVPIGKQLADSTKPAITEGPSPATP